MSSIHHQYLSKILKIDLKNDTYLSHIVYVHLVSHIKGIKYLRSSSSGRIANQIFGSLSYNKYLLISHRDAYRIVLDLNYCNNLQKMQFSL